MLWLYRPPYAPYACRCQAVFGSYVFITSNFHNLIQDTRHLALKALRVRWGGRESNGSLHDTLLGGQAKAEASSWYSRIKPVFPTGVARAVERILCSWAVLVHSRWSSLPVGTGRLSTKTIGIQEAAAHGGWECSGLHRRWRTWGTIPCHSGPAALTWHPAGGGRRAIRCSRVYLVD